MATDESFPTILKPIQSSLGVREQLLPQYQTGRTRADCVVTPAFAGRRVGEKTLRAL